jgi:hypothetical protein
MALDKLKSSALDTNIDVAGDLTVDTNTLHVDSTNNHVGIGTSTDTAYSDLHIKTSLGAAPTNSSSSGAIRLTSNATAGVGVGPSILFRGQTGNSTAEYSFGSIQGVKSSSGTNDYSGDLVFYTQNSTGASAHSERLRLLSAGGITFNGDTAAANALDDYEQGIFSSTCQLYGTSSGSVTSSYASYTKIGNVVQINLYFNNTGSSFSGEMRISGLPFATSSVGLQPISSFHNYHSGADTRYIANVMPSATTIQFYREDGTGRDNVQLTNTWFNTYTDLYISGSYMSA